MSAQNNSDIRRRRAIARRKRVIRNRIVLAAGLFAVIVIVIVILAVSCGKGKEGSRGSTPQSEQQSQTDSGSGQNSASGKDSASGSDSSSGKDSEADSRGETATGQDGNADDGQTAETQTEARRKYTAGEYEAAGVNELKDIPILMYHRIYDMKNSETEFTGGNVDASGYNRTSEAFEADLEFYYENGYRTIRIADYVKGYIDVPFGMTPVILTFDDGYNNALLDGFDADGNPIFQKGCAMEVLERVKARHPDFNLTATFFLNQHLFTNCEEDDIRLIKWMVDNGYDIGNHTKTHPDLSKLTAAEIEEEIGYEYKLLNDIIPGRYVDIVALPYGSPSDVSDHIQRNL